MVAGDFNVNLLETEGDRRGEDIAAAMATEGLEDMSTHFLPCRRSCCWDGRTWSMIWEEREVRSRTDYILGTDRCIFGDVSVRDPRHNSDHYLVLGCLPSAPLRDHTRYLRGRKRLPLLPPTALTREDEIFAALWRASPNPLARDTRNVKERVSARQDSAKNQSLIWRLNRVIAASLRNDRRRRAEEAGAEVEVLLGSDPPIHQEA